MDYLSIWSNITKKNVATIQTIQNKAIRNMFNLEKTTRVKEIYKMTNLLPLEEIMKTSIIIHTHNIINNFILTNTTFNKNQNILTYQTRSANLLRQHKLNTSIFGSTSFRNKATNLYNAIPNEYKQLNKENFKRKI